MTVNLLIKKETAMDIDKVRQAFSEFWADELLEGWYNTANQHLNNATPAQFVAAGDTDRVLEAITSAAYGVYS